MSGLVEALRERSAETDAGSPDPELRGRTYAIPFDTVWKAATGILNAGVRGWSLIRSDDRAGTIVGLVQPGPLSKHADLLVTIGLDEMAQTRVDFSATSRTGRGDLGRSRRILQRFFQLLDERLGAGPQHILDPATLHALAESVVEVPLAESVGDASPAAGAPEGRDRTPS